MIINWNISEEDRDLVDRITDRALARYPEWDQTCLLMDITAVHCNGNPLRLADMLSADDFNFWHDIGGITRHINRDTAQLENCFVPRFSKRKG